MRLVKNRYAKGGEAIRYTGDNVGDVAAVAATCGARAAGGSSTGMNIEIEPVTLPTGDWLVADVAARELSIVSAERFGEIYETVSEGGAS
mgnify:CR=1 FL=1